MNTPNKPAQSPIRVARLLVVSTNPAGIRNPLDSDRVSHTLASGEAGDVRTEIEYRPWMRHHRVSRATRVNNGTGKPDTWKPIGAWYVHESMVTWTPAEEQ
jgi:hypothetical protein